MTFCLYSFERESDCSANCHACGLSAIQAARLFDRFCTVNHARKSTGLGLSIAKLLTEKMGGTITAVYQNEVLRICIFLPCIDNE